MPAEIDLDSGLDSSRSGPRARPGWYRQRMHGARRRPKGRPAGARAALIAALAAAGLCQLGDAAAQAQSAEPRSAGPTVAISPLRPAAGDPVLITVTGVKARPKGKVGRKQLLFFDTRTGWQAVFAVPLERAPGTMTATLRGGLPSQTFDVSARTLPETAIQVPDELIRLTPETKKRVDDDNRAIRKSFARANGPALFRRPFVWPVSSDPTSPFGEMRIFNGTLRSHHLGLDLAARQGAPIKVVNDGTVVLVRDCFLAGGVVVVSHGAGIASSYFHLSEALVKEGDPVERGAVIGRTGSTGRATGPHVHVSIWALNDFVDPATFLRLGFVPRDEPEGVAAGKGVGGKGQGKEPKKETGKDAREDRPAKKAAPSKSSKSSKSSKAPSPSKAPSSSKSKASARPGK